MFSNLADFFFGKEQEETIISKDVEIKEEDDWVIIGTNIEEMEKKPFLADNNSVKNDKMESIVNMEESWFVTPPPFFNGDGPSQLSTSPLENLLIEHPSMSVYMNSTVIVNAYEIDNEEEADESQQPSSTNSEVASQARGSATRQRSPPSLLKCAQAECLQLQRKAQLRRSHRNNSPKYLERSNKIVECSTKGKHKKRCDKFMHNSGANNNRKC